MWTSADFDKTRWVEKDLSAIYVAKHGDDRNDGHPQRAVASIARAIVLAKALQQGITIGDVNPYGNLNIYLPIVVASGVYNESLQMNGIVLKGDGFVLIDGAGSPQFNLNEGNMGLVRVTVQNFSKLNPGGSTGIGAFNCIFRNIGLLHEGNSAYATWTFGSCLFVNAPRLQQGDGAVWVWKLLNCTLINSQFSAIGYNNDVRSISVQNCYVDPTSSIGYKTGNLHTINNCNIEGFIHTRTGYGDANNHFYRLADYQLIEPGLAVNCLSVPPGFNNTDANDYTLAATSQMRNLAFDGGFAGAYGIGINFSGLADAQNIVNARYDSGLGAFVLDNPAQKGSIEFNVKDFQRNWILKEALLVGEEDNVDNQTIDATISYDLDGFGMPADVQSGGLESGRTYWNNGYDQIIYLGQAYASGQYFACTTDLTYTTIGAGKVVKLNEAPNIRLYEMKYSTLSAVDCVSRPWSYFVFNKVPTVDAAGRTNGDVLFNPATANPITVRYVKLRLTLMPNSLA